MQASGFRELTRLHEGGQAVVYRARRLQDDQAVVLKMLRGPYPSPEQRARFRREYELTRTVAGDGVVRVEGWALENGIPIIVLEDFNARSLDLIFAEERPSLERALELAIAIVDALQRVHERQVLHLDVNPANVVVSEDGSTLKLIDFGLAADVPRQVGELRSRQVLQGTLRFVAPEQTGRVNRSVDHRSDYYSFGATLYWLVTGRPPFTSEDPLELVHAHIARRPDPPVAVTPAAPACVSEMILKLLEKNAEDRYQSSYGIRADLERCRAIVSGKLAADDFRVGEKDRPAHFRIPERLYGRDEELATLLSLFQRAREGAREVAFVHGGSGMGKTSLVREVQRTMLASGAAFVAGKFSQFQRDIPYASLSEALRQFVQLILTGQQGDVATWRQRIAEALTPNARLLTALIPELELVLAEEELPPLQELPALESEKRLHHTVRRFMRVLARVDHPLVLFMDDLQWADLPSLSLLRVLATDTAVSHLVLIGAYRDNEVGPGHPLRALVSELGEADVPTSALTVRPLTPDAVTALLSDTLHRSPAAVGQLAAHCHEKTAGNPFFLHRFLLSLVGSELVRFDATAGAWKWDEQAIAELEVTSNVVDFLASRFDLLTEASQRQLEAAAVVGGSFDSLTLAGAQELAPELVEAELGEPLRDGLIEEIEGRGSEGRSFRFAHDRIQQAAYARTSPETRRRLHHRVGRRMLEAEEDVGFGEALFDVVNHLNEGLWDDTPAEERLQLAQLNLKAGRRALSASAHAPAERHSRVARELLGAAGWSTHPEAMREATELSARAAYLTKSYDRMEKLVDEVSEHARDELDRVRALRVRIDALIAQNRNAEAIATGLDALELLGTQLPREPGEAEVGAALTETFGRLEGVDLSTLAERAPPKDSRAALAMELVCVLAPPAYFVNQLLLPILGAELVRWTLQAGPTAESAYGFSLLGLVMCNVGDIDQGYAFGRLARDLAARFDDKRLRVRANHVFYGFSRHWKESAASIMPDYAALFHEATDVGDFEYAGYGGMMHTIFGFYMAPELGKLAASARMYTRALGEMQQGPSLSIQGILDQAIVNLRSPSGDPLLLKGEVYDEIEMRKVFESLGDPTGLFVLNTVKGVVAGYFGEWERAVRSFEVARRYTHGSAAVIHMVFLEQWDALACISRLVQSDAEQAQLLERAKAALEKLVRWAEHNPDAHGHRPDLVRAAFARLDGDLRTALDGFEEAAHQARERNLPMDEAIAHQLAGEMCLAASWPTAARAHLIEARYAWDRWGATAVRERLEERHPRQLGDLGTRVVGTTLSLTTSVGTSEVPDIDAVAVVRASQAIAKELELERVIATLVRIAMEVSGAARCLVVSPAETGDVITARGSSEPEPEVSQEPCFLAGSGLAPEGILGYVVRTRKELVLDNASTSELFSAEPYVTEHQVKSVLCVPIEQQGRLLAVLYLEHAGSTSVFTPERLALLRVLLSQAAISVENARLVDNLEEKVRERTNQLAIAAERATAASEAKTAFVRSVSHELRTPLNAILGYAELLQEGTGFSDKERDGLKTIQRSGRHLLSLINDILDMSRIEAGRLDLVAEPTRLAGLVEEVADLCRPTALQKGLKLDVEADATLPDWIEGDATRLRQILLNLVGNAVKFTSAGVVRVTTQGAGGQLRVEVTDTGPGVTSGRLESIFEPFEQAGDTAQRAQGTGLGLAISRSIARKMGGDIRVESELGRGSSFLLELPLRPCQAPDEDTNARVDDSAAQPAPEVNQLVPSAGDFVWPSREELELLSRLATEGALSQVSRRAAELAASDAALRPFTERLAALADQFDDAGLEALLADGLASAR